MPCTDSWQRRHMGYCAASAVGLHWSQGPKWQHGMRMYVPLRAPHKGHIWLTACLRSRVNSRDTLSAAKPLAAVAASGAYDAGAGTCCELEVMPAMHARTLCGHSAQCAAFSSNQSHDIWLQHDTIVARIIADSSSQECMRRGVELGLACPVLGSCLAAGTPKHPGEGVCSGRGRQHRRAVLHSGAHLWRRRRSLRTRAACSPCFYRCCCSRSSDSRSLPGNCPMSICCGS